MKHRALGAGWLVVAAAAGMSSAQEPPYFDRPVDDERAVQPLMLANGIDVPSVYAPPALPTEAEGVNEGGVGVDLTVRYVTDYVFRGIEVLEVPSGEDTLNLQVEGMIELDFGRLPHPFVGLFSNIANQDPISDFQEIRPFFGLELEVRPFTFTVGHNSFFYPDREDLDTSEVWGRVVLDDAWLWSTPNPILSPYVFAAYDYDRYDGWYCEAGVTHDVELPELGLVLTFHGAVAYVRKHPLFTLEDENDSGLQHYQVGLTGRYSLNKLLNTSQHFGEWSLIGYVNYTGSIDDALRADDQLWGGAAISFSY